jgi:H+/Cl- antiporter ClcA
MIFPFLGIDPGVYAVVGATAMLSSVTRMTISCAVMMLELTSDFEFIVPSMIAVLVAKRFGSIISPSIFEMMMEFKNIPFLPADPSPELERMVCSFFFFLLFFLLVLLNLSLVSSLHFGLFFCSSVPNI